AIAALDEPTRRQLYDYVVRQPEPVSRDEAAAALQLPRSTAAFHLDRLVDQALLDVIHQRRSGRTGPGAGRPAKLYRRSPQHVTVSLPPRHYDLAGGLLSAAVEQAERSGHSPQAILHQRAYQLGKELAETAPVTADEQDTRDTVLGVLRAHGYEPCTTDGAVTLANCPFHALARQHTELICGMNLRLLQGLLDGLALTGLTAHLRPSPTLCCVHLEDTTTGHAAAEPPPA
ncbi:MAG: helix-turn-helix domain-containing protein, partial [Acidobacteria bacterium]|nr:helix-turn-helix domain-containing protein [Acidobacteriota bacterium]